MTETKAASPPMRLVGRDERELLLRHREGDPEAFAALVEEYRAPVYGYLVRTGVAPEERDDVFQEIFLRIHRAAESYQAQRPVHPWIFTIVCNAVRTHLRRRRVRELVFAEPADGGAEDPADERPDGEAAAAARQRVALLERALGRLSVAQREVVLLAGVEKLGMQQIAEVLDLPVGTVKTHLRRARLALAQALVAA